MLTPEEWVRQHFIHFLVSEKNYPASLISTEVGMKYNKMQKRSDIIAYQNSGQPLLIVECKAPTVKITQDTFDQAARYNMVMKVKFVAITNGLQHYYCQIDHKEKSYTFIEELPSYELL